MPRPRYLGGKYLISILTSAKPFVGYNAETQTQAIRNWKSLGDSVEVLVYGGVGGTEDVLLELGCKWVPDIECTELGVPLMPAILSHAGVEAKYDRLMYTNCDMLYTDRLLKVWELADIGDKLIVGQRLDLPKVPTSFSGPDIIREVKQMIPEGHVGLHAPSGSDYFCFSRGFGEGMGQVVIGRGGYDNAMMAHALSTRLPMVDATRYLPAFHLPHDYSHVGKGLQGVWKGREAQQNRDAIGNKPVPVVSDADYALVSGALVRNRGRGDFTRHWLMRMSYGQGLSKSGELALHRFGQLLRLAGLSKEKALGVNDLDYLLECVVE